MMETIETVERSFYTLLEDSIELIRMAERFQHFYPLARSAAITSLLLLETAANCCLDSLALDKRSFEEYDRLSAASKFDLYLRIKHKRSLDRSRHEYAIYKELKKIRDNVVHPKSFKVQWEMESDDSGQADLKETPVLKVSQQFRDWWLKDAKIIFKNVHLFLEFFFKDQCKLKPMYVSSIVFSEEKVPNKKDGYFLPRLTKEDELLYEQCGVNIRYLKWS